MTLLEIVIYFALMLLSALLIGLEMYYLSMLISLSAIIKIVYYEFLK